MGCFCYRYPGAYYRAPRMKKSRKEYHRRWYKKNKKRANANSRAWRKKNKKRAAALTRAWTKKNSKRHKASCRRWYKKNKKYADARNRAWQKKNPKRCKILAKRSYNKHIKYNRARSLAWYRNNKKRVSTARHDWGKKNPRQAKDRRLKRKYGITMKEFLLFRKAQNNRCAICRKLFRQTPHVDHDHKTGLFRGLLCFHCNVGIGMLKDSYALLESASKYIREAGRRV